MQLSEISKRKLRCSKALYLPFFSCQCHCNVYSIEWVMSSPRGGAQVLQRSCQSGKFPRLYQILRALDHEFMEQEPENRITILGQTNYRDHRFVFGIKKKDRRYHTYIIGQTGTGKSTLLENMIRQDVENGEGLAILDPHGDFAERIAKTVPEKRKE